MSALRWTMTLGLCLGVAACAGRSPEPAVYALAAVAGTAQNAATAPHTVEVRRIGLAGYLDRPEIVRTQGDYRLAISAKDRWGEPLDDMIGRVLAEDLGQRLPGSTVFSEAGAVSADGEAILEVDIQRFDADPDGTVVVLAQVSTRRGAGRGNRATRSARFGLRPTGRDTGALVAALSAGLGQLADASATMLIALPPARTTPGSGSG